MYPKILERVPWWAWLALAAAIYVGAHEARASWTISRLQRQVDEGKTEAIQAARAAAVKAAEEQRAVVAAERAQLATERQQAAAQVVALKATVAQLEERGRVLAMDLGQREAAHRALVDTGTVDDVVAAARALGYHPRTAPRP